jgi:hypothetical protein
MDRNFIEGSFGSKLEWTTHEYDPEEERPSWRNPET